MRYSHTRMNENEIDDLESAINVAGYKGIIRFLKANGCAVVSINNKNELTDYFDKVNAYSPHYLINMIASAFYNKKPYRSDDMMVCFSKMRGLNFFEAFEEDDIDELCKIAISWCKRVKKLYPNYEFERDMAML